MGELQYCGKTVYLVGGSTGIRLAIAQKMIEQGAKISLLACNETRLKQAVSEGPRLLPPGQEATIFMKALSKHRPLIIPGKAAKFSVLMKRWAPGLLEWVMDRDIRWAI
jgi:NAD(P)-dependent dehydrogenase (short-subunit alcohol dehydrogenase family)